MSLKALILLALLSKDPHSKDIETWQQREARMEIMADAVVSAVNVATCTEQPSDCRRIWPGSPKELAMSLVTLAHYESNFAQHIHEGRCNLAKGECDARRVPVMNEWGKAQRVARSISPWQIQKFDIPDDEWTKISSGVEGTSLAAWHAARRLSSAYRSCGGYEGAFARYATGRSCDWAGAAPRVRTLESFMSLSEDTLRKRVDQQKALYPRKGE
jgi:hypothetical protein